TGQYSSTKREKRANCNCRKSAMPGSLESPDSLAASRPMELGNMAAGPVQPPVITGAELQKRDKNLRRHVLRMAERAGQGYVGQGLGIADLLAILYFHELRYDPGQLYWPDRDRF